MSIEAAIAVWWWEGLILASIAGAVLLWLIVHERYAARKRTANWEGEQERKMDDYTNRRLSALEKSTNELETRAMRRRAWADLAKSMLRGLPFIAAAFILAMSTFDNRLINVAALFLGLGGWLMIMVAI